MLNPRRARTRSTGATGSLPILAECDEGIDVHVRFVHSFFFDSFTDSPITERNVPSLPLADLLDSFSIAIASCRPSLRQCFFPPHDPPVPLLPPSAVCHCRH
jgi:hypothetical protein